MHFYRGAASSFLIWTLASFRILLAAQSLGSLQPDTLKRADAAFRAGYAALQAGKLEQARVQFAESVRLAPQIPEGHEALGEVLFELDKPAEAASELEIALQLKPGDQGIEANLAQAY